MSQLATRMIAAAALIVAIGLGLHVARAQQPATKRTDLQRHDVSGSGGEAARAIVEVSLADEQTATGWLNSQPLAATSLRGKVVLVDFWTFTCVNWLRTLPYLRADWYAEYMAAEQSGAKLPS